MGKRLYWIADVFNAADADNRSYRHLTVRFRGAHKGCALKAVQEAMEWGNSPKEALELVAVVRAATGETVYYIPVHRAEFTVRWQADVGVGAGLAVRELLLCSAREPSEWYGPRVEDAHLHPKVAAAIAKLSTLYEPSPADVLAKLRARPVVYTRPQSGLGVWVDAPQEPDLRSPMDYANAG